MNNIHEQQKRTDKDTIHDYYCPRWCVLCFHYDPYTQKWLVLWSGLTETVCAVRQQLF